MKKKKVILLKSADWAVKFGINFLEFKGFPSKEYFDKVPIDKNTFLLYASNCTLSEPIEKTRRAVSNFKHKLMNNVK